MPILAQPTTSIASQASQHLPRTLPQSLAAIWREIQVCLLPSLEECLEEPLTQRLRQLVNVLEVVRIEEAEVCNLPQHLGRRREDRRPIARAFVAKAVYDLPSTDLLLEMLILQPTLRRICGWERRRDIPSPSTFSRAFAEFAAADLGDKVHASLVAEHVADQIVMHVSRDATEIVAREKPAKKPPKTSEEPKPRRGRGRPKGSKDPKPGEVRPPKEPTRMEKQLSQSVEAALCELPYLCDVGTKIDSKGHKHSWIGWKAHLDWSDGGLPLNVLTTSASLHDSQVAIPMLRQTAGRVTSLYDLMDASYDAGPIDQASRELGHVPIIDLNQRGRKEPRPSLDPAASARFAERTTAERGNARLKDEFGCRHLRVRGHKKAHLHVLFGVLALFADALLRPFLG